MVKLVPEAIKQATGTTTGVVAFGHFFHVKTAHAQYASNKHGLKNYAGIMLDVLKGQLCS